MHEVTKAVVTNNDVRIPLAARGVIAVHIEGLHAKGTRNIRARHLETKPVTHGCAKHRRGEATVRSIETGWDGSHPSPGMLCQQAGEPLMVTLGQRLLYQAGVGAFVNEERGLRLGPCEGIGLWWPSPRLAGGRLDSRQLAAKAPSA